MKITNIMLANRLGGICQAYIDYNEALSRRGHTVQAICHRRSSWLEATREQLGRFPRMKMASVRHKGGIWGPLSAWAIRREVAAFRPDLIVIHNYRSLLLMACCGLAPTVTVTHMYKTKHFERFDLIIALTRELSQMCQDAGIPPEKIRIVPNFIRGPFHAPEPIKNQPIVLGSLGRLDIEKGFSHLINACRLLKDRGIPFKCKIGGIGFQEQALKDLAEESGLQSVVEFLGLVTDKDAFFQSIDLFIVASTSETFGITILEGMKFGKPIISSDIGGPAEILTHNQTGLLVKPACPLSIADAVEQLIHSPDQAVRLANNAAQVVENTYSEDVVGQTLEQALEELCASRT